MVASGRPDHKVVKVFERRDDQGYRHQHQVGKHATTSDAIGEFPDDPDQATGWTNEGAGFDGLKLPAQETQAIQGESPVVGRIRMIALYERHIDVDNSTGSGSDKSRRLLS